MQDAMTPDVGQHSVVDIYIYIYMVLVDRIVFLKWVWFTPSFSFLFVERYCWPAGALWFRTRAV